LNLNDPAIESRLAVDGAALPIRVLIGVCTFNEASNIGPLLSRLRKSIPEADIVVVDDNSPDGTASRVRDAMETDDKIHLVVREHERGLGGAILHAISVAIDADSEFFLNLDADLSHSPEQLAELLALARHRPDVDVVVGSRYVDGGKIEGWPLRRRVMSRMLNRFGTIGLGLPVRDCSGSMRCYRVESLRKLDFDGLKSRGYALLEELLVHLNSRGSKMAEVPITFVDRQQGESKLTIGEALRSVSQMLKLAASRR
tara:strand:- start:164502 stop:165272 length:771 start_codon:yes stop_codon:yes gene_type:complete